MLTLWLDKNIHSTCTQGATCWQISVHKDLHVAAPVCFHTKETRHVLASLESLYSYVGQYLA